MYSLIIGFLIFIQSFSPKDFTSIGLYVDETVSKETIKIITKSLEDFYHVKVKTIKGLKVPVEHKKDTINAWAVIKYLEDRVEPSCQKNIYLTHRGIALSDNAKYSVRGLAMIGKSYGVVSNLVVKHESSSKKEYRYRLGKVAIHETGHLLGLEHCEADDKCIMVSTLHGPELFYNSDNRFCNSCLTKIED